MNDDAVESTYHLRQRVIGQATAVPICEAEFEALKTARSTLVDALAFEQRFELVVANWLALERAATEMSLRSIVENWISYGKSSDSFTEMNRHVMNLMSTARAYVDQVKSDFVAASLSPPFKQSATKLLHAAYDTSSDFRFMEALRNHVQHSGSAVHKIASNPNRAPSGGWAERLSFFATKSLLEQAGGLKARVLHEMPKEVDLRLAAREYLERLSATHVELRRLVAPSVNASRTAFESAIAKYKTAGAESAIGLHAVAPVNLKIQPVLIMLEWDDARIALAAKNAVPVTLSKR